MIYTMMGFLLCVIAVLVGYMFFYQSIWDQIVCMNIITNLVVLLILLFTIEQETFMTIDTAIVFALLSFVGSLFIIIFVYRRGDLS